MTKTKQPKKLKAIEGDGLGYQIEEEEGYDGKVIASCSRCYPEGCIGIEEQNAKDLVSAYNFTHAKGISPESVPEMLKALEQIMSIPHTIHNVETAIHMMHQKAKETIALTKKEK